ncbi:MAG: ABC transporter permease [Candidatus Diapherotrites archaeon]|nr:ABC transporter permease [Candidatus Diapherotrites archaeon]
MNAIDITEFVIKTFREGKLRTFLTLVGIVIGVAAITTLFSVGTSLNATIENVFLAFGTDMIYIEPGMSISEMMTTKISDDAIKLAEGVRGVKEVIPFYETSSVGKIGSTESGFFIFGIDPAKFATFDESGYFTVLEGRPLNKGEIYSVLTYKDALKKSFGKEIKLGQSIEFNKKKFKIVGFLAENSMMSVSLGGTNLLIVSDTAAKELFDTKDAMEAAVTVFEGYDLTDVGSKIETKLDDKYGKGVYTILTPDEALAQVGQIILIVQVVLGFIAFISLIVGGIGIINTMVMNVNERVQEIGTMKAIGATNTTIEMLFLFEALIMGLGGGLIGVVIGYIMTFAVVLVAGATGFPMIFTIDWGLAGGMIIFACAMGAVAGIIPARIAASMEPTKALRYE